MPISPSLDQYRSLPRAELVACCRYVGLPAIKGSLEQEASTSMSSHRLCSMLTNLLNFLFSSLVTTVQTPLWSMFLKQLLYQI